MAWNKHIQSTLLWSVSIAFLLTAGTVHAQASPVAKNLILNYTWDNDDLRYGDSNNLVRDASGLRNNGFNKQTTRMLTDNNSFYREFTNDSTYIITKPFTQLTPPYTIEWYGIVDSDANTGLSRMICDLGSTRGTCPMFSPNYLNTGKPAIFLGSHNYMLGSTNLRDGKPHHVVFVVTGRGQNDIDNASIYVDGAKEKASGVDNSGPAAPPAATLHIGALGFDGKTYLFRVYDRMAFNQSQVAQNYGDCRGRAGRSLQSEIDESVARTGTYTFTRGYDGGSGGYTLYIPSNAIIRGNGIALHNISLAIKNNNNITIYDVVNGGSRLPLSPFSIAGACDRIAFINCHVNNLRTGLTYATAFDVLPSPGATISNVTFRDCHVDDTDCFGYTLWGNSNGARNISYVYFINCTASRCGYFARTNNYTVGFDLGEDAGNSLLTVTNVLVRNSTASNCWESGFHMEYSTISHNVTIRDSVSYNNGVKPSATFGSGFLMHAVTMNNCTTGNNSRAGYSISNFPFASPTGDQISNPWLRSGSALNNCTDIGSSINLIITGDVPKNGITSLNSIDVNNFSGLDAERSMLYVNNVTNINIVNFTGTTECANVTPIFLYCSDDVTLQNMNIHGGNARAITVRDVESDGNMVIRNSALTFGNGQPNTCLAIKKTEDSHIVIGRLNPSYTYKVLAGGSPYAGWTMRDNSTVEITLMPGSQTYTLLPGSATLISKNVTPSMDAGKSYAASLTFRNDGNIAWSASDLFTFAGVGDGPGDAALFGPVRLGMAPGTIVLPGQQYTWRFNLTAPTPATQSTYYPSYRMAWEGHDWVGDIVNNTVTVSLPYDASVTANTFSSTMYNRTSSSITIAMKNIGTENWTGNNGFMLEAVGGSKGDAALFGPVRLGMAPGTIVQPGQQYRWTFNVTAPASPGMYYPSYRMVKNNQTWIGQTASCAVRVIAPGTPQAYTVRLKSGWDLISIPLALQDNRIDHLFPDNVKKHILVVWAYDGAKSQWLFYTPQPGYDPNTLASIDPGQGYWVYTDQDASFNITGTLAESDNELVDQGWNLVGNPVLYVRDIKGVYPNGWLIWGYKNGQWSYYTTRPGYDPNTLHSLEPGYGYWVCNM